MWDSGEDSDACFWRAVPFAKQVLENEIAAANAVNRADETVQNAYKNSRDALWSCRTTCPGKRPVQNRCPVCCLPQPARRVERPVRDRLQDPPQQGAVPARMGRPPEEILREKSGLAL